MSTLKGKVAKIRSSKTVRLSLIAVFVVVLVAALAAGATAQTAPATSATVSVPFGSFAAYSFQNDVTGKKIGVTMTYSPTDPKDAGQANAKSVVLDVYGPASLPPAGKAIGSASGPAGKLYFQIENPSKGQYVVVVRNWDSLKRTVSATVSAAYVGGANIALKAVSGEAAPAASKAPTAAIDIIAVSADANDPNVITKTLADGKTNVRMYTNGLKNVPVDVPVFAKAEAAGATSYAWTLTGPSASKAKLAKNNTATVSFTPDVVGVYKLDLVASNAAGASPMASVQIYAGTFIGVEKGGCVKCHPEEVEAWEKTGHAMIFEEEIEGGADPKTSHYGEGCLRCHTTGYFIGANNNGFTDVQAEIGWKFPALADIQAGKIHFENLPAGIKNMGNIQCEVCHGPAQQHVEKGAPMDATLASDLCNACHDGGGHHIKGREFANAKHSHEESQAWNYPTGPARQACVQCHSGEGFIDFVANPTELASFSNKAEPLQCASCHDPHGNGNTYQLRLTGKAVQLPGKIDKDFGLSTNCVECHNARNQGSDAVKGTFPHYSAAAEMLANTGGVTYGQNVPNSPHSIVGAAPVRNPDPAAESPMLWSNEAPGPCVACHMFPTADAKSGYQYKVGEHSFNTVSPDGKFEYTAPCVSCHPGIKDFNLQAKADYDGNGKAESVRAEVAGLLHTLEKAINASGVRSVVGHPYFDRNDTAKANDKQKNAIYNYLFVRGLEGTDGKAAAIHNFKRSVALLQLSYKDLTGSDVPGATLMK